jgi:hypothetical protein
MLLQWFDAVQCNAAVAVLQSMLQLQQLLLPSRSVTTGRTQHGPLQTAVPVVDFSH